MLSKGPGPWPAHLHPDERAGGISQTALPNPTGLAQASQAWSWSECCWHVLGLHNPGDSILYQDSYSHV